MDKKWLSLPILIACFWIDICLYNLPKKETAPMMTEVLNSENDRPEGSSYEYDRFMQEISKLVDDSIPQKKSESSGYLLVLVLQ
jgi:HAE1 family hydrophobic/amphiphilic exporter-1/multidrug efflux pump